MKPNTVAPRRLFDKALRMSLIVISLPIAVIAIVCLYGIVTLLLGEWDSKESVIALAFFALVGLASFLILLQCLYVGFTGLFPRWISDVAADEIERLARKPKRFFIFSIIFSVAFVVFAIICWKLLSTS